jgi:site-specific DNA recombinase
MVTATAIYARISQDRSGEALGVSRQIEDCRAEAERRRWPVAEVYVDDDISAYSGKVRPQYRRMLSDIGDGLIDAVIVWHLDRLHRQPRELEEFVDVCAAARLKNLATLHGEVDLGSGDGMLLARIMAAVAANESDAKSRRVRRKMDQRAQQGRPHGGSSRPFGYEPDKVTVRESEAQTIRDLAERFLSGESLASLARWLNSAGIPTSTGKRWRPGGVRSLLSSARISGQRTHRGEIVGPAAWPGIITPQHTAMIRSLLADPERRTNRTPRRYLLASMLRCGNCGTVLVAHPRNGVRRYVCKSGAGLLGCGRVSIDAARLEELISEGVLYRLDTPEAAAALAGTRNEHEAAWSLAESVAREEGQLDELAGLYSQRQITAREWIEARKPIEARLKQAKHKHARAQRSGQVEAMIGAGGELRAKWSGLNLDRQRAVVAAVLNYAIVRPYTAAGPSRFDPDRVEPIWRL